MLLNFDHYLQLQYSIRFLAPHLRNQQCERNVSRSSTG